MNSGPDCNIRDLVIPNTWDEEASVDRVRERLTSSMLVSDTAPPNRRQGFRTPRRRVLVIGIACLLSISAGAFAAQQGGLFSSESTIDRLDVLREDAPAENRLPESSPRDFRIETWPVPESVGELAPTEQARMLIEHDFNGYAIRVVATPTSRGMLCYAMHAGVTFADFRPRVQTCGGFRAGWPLIESSGISRDKRTLFYGVAADEVGAVTFLIGDERAAAVMGQNAYAWESPGEALPSAIEVRLDDGTVGRRELGRDPVRDEFTDPFIVTREGTSRER